MTFPTAGWELREFTLTSTNGFGSCLSVSQLKDNNILQAGQANLGVIGTSYSGQRTFAPGIQSFSVTYSGGLRILLNSQTVFDNWSSPISSVQTSVIRTQYLAAGTYDVTIQHYGDASTQSMFQVNLAAGCGTITATGSAWVLGFYMREGNTVDMSKCLGVQVLPSTDDLSLNWNNTMSPLVNGISEDYAVIGYTSRQMYGNTSFQITHSGGVNLSIDSSKLYTHLQGASTGTAGAYAKNLHTFSFELLSSNLAASVQVSWSTTCSQISLLDATTWSARYYRLISNGTTYALDYGDCLFSETIPSTRLDFTWGVGSPGPLQSLLAVTNNWGVEYFSNRTLAGVGPAQISLAHSDGMRVYIDGLMLYNHWMPGGTANMSTISITAGIAHSVLVRYFDQSGTGANLHVDW